MFLKILCYLYDDKKVCVVKTTRERLLL